MEHFVRTIDRVPENLLHHQAGGAQIYDELQDLVVFPRQFGGMFVRIAWLVGRPGRNKAKPAESERFPKRKFAASSSETR